MRPLAKTTAVVAVLLAAAATASASPARRGAGAPARARDGSIEVFVYAVGGPHRRGGARIVSDVVVRISARSPKHTLISEVHELPAGEVALRIQPGRYEATASMVPPNVTPARTCESRTLSVHSGQQTIVRLYSQVR